MVRPELADELLSTPEASTLVNLSPHTLRTYRLNGPEFTRLPDGRVRYSREALEAWQADRSAPDHHEIDAELLETLAALADTVALLLGRRPGA